MMHEQLVSCKEKDDFKSNLEEGFTIRLTHLLDIFEVANGMNLFSQGGNSTIADFISNLEAFVRKLDTWMKNSESKQYGMFKYLTTFQRRRSDELSQEINLHLKLLRTDPTHYFPYIVLFLYLLIYLFYLWGQEKEEITDIQSHENAQAKQRKCSPTDFWLSVAFTYPVLP